MPAGPWQVQEVQGGLVGLPVCMKRAFTQEKAEQAHRGSGSDSDSLLLPSPLPDLLWRGALSCYGQLGAEGLAGSALAHGWETSTGHLTQHWQSQPARGEGPMPHPTPTSNIAGLGLTRVIQEVLLPWAPITHRKSRRVVAMKQNTDVNMTQPWISGMGTWDEAIRIHTSPPKTCRGRERRGEGQTGRAHAQVGPDPEVTLGSQGHSINVNSVNPHNIPVSVVLTHS